MTLNAASELQFSSPAGEANYRAARRRYPAQAIVDLATLRDNMAHLVDVVGGPHSGTAVMGVVKADAYGHGLLPAALAALAGGATWLGTAQSHEALLLRKLGIGPDRCHILTWVYNGTEVPFDELIAADIDVSVGSLPGIDAVAAAARKLGKPARVHVKVDSGFGRNGFTPAGFDAALAKLVPLAKEGVLHIVGQWSHLAVADSPDVSEFVSSTDRQIETFKDFTRRMEQAGIPPEIRHLANTAATLDRPEIHFELTRPGIGLYGYQPCPETTPLIELRPAMSVHARITDTRLVPMSEGVSYGLNYRSPGSVKICTVPVGYGDGLRRGLSSRTDFLVDGVRCRQVGNICMDQCMFEVDLRSYARRRRVDPQVGDEVLIVGQQGDAMVTIEEMCETLGTIPHELCIGFAQRMPRYYV